MRAKFCRWLLTTLRIFICHSIISLQKVFPSYSNPLHFSSCDYVAIRSGKGTRVELLESNRNKLNKQSITENISEEISVMKEDDQRWREMGVEWWRWDCDVCIAINVVQGRERDDILDLKNMWLRKKYGTEIWPQFSF